ncbi:hypothetical protein OF83DRAFT_1049042 [Amylostereum chailletii]|nr:hypothetical protein OF83DRAFT_1049042 [Amylostereum chailletii]
MKFSSSFLALSAVAAAIFADAAPLHPRHKKSGAVSMKNNSSAATGATMGAAYFISNEPSGNFIVSADIGSDGKLSLAQATFTDGRGQHGDDAGKNGPDALFSQGVIKTNAAAGLVATANPGSNSISLFKADSTTPSKLTAFGSPISSGGEFPMSVAFNANGTMLCALNGGAVNGVQCFTMDKDLGLVPAANTQRAIGLNQTTPPSGPAGSTSHLIFTEDQSTLVAAVKGNPDVNQTGFLAAWDVQADGSLSKDFTRVELPSGGALPFALANIPGKNSLFVADAAVGADIFDLKGGVASLAANGNSSAAASSASSAVQVANSTAVCWNSFSKKTGNFYVTDIGTSLVTEINVADDLKGSIVKQYTTQTGAATIDLDVAAIGSNDFLYVMMANATSIQVMSLNGPGDATKLQTLDLAAPAKNVGLSLSASNLQGMTVLVKAK